MGGAGNVESASSTAGVCSPSPVTGGGNCGDLAPTFVGVPDDPTEATPELRIIESGGIGAAGFAWRATGAPDWIGADDGRRYHRVAAPFILDSHPNAEGGECLAYSRAANRVLVGTVRPAPGFADLILRYQTPDDEPNAWTEITVDPAALTPPGPPPVETNPRAALCELQDGTLLWAYTYLKSVGTFDNVSVAILKSEDGGLSWRFISSGMVTSLSLAGHSLRLTASGSWVRVDMPSIGIAATIRSSASQDGGVSWTRQEQAAITTFQGGTVSDPSPFDVAGLGGGRFAVAYMRDSATQWGVGHAFGGSSWGAGGTSAVRLTRTALADIAGIGLVRQRDRVIAMISTTDGGGSSDNDQLSMFWHSVERIASFGPGSSDQDDPDPEEWQPVEAITRWRGVRYDVARIHLADIGGRAIMYAATAHDSVSLADRAAVLTAQIGGFSASSLGAVAPGSPDLRTSPDLSTSPELYDLIWGANNGAPAGVNSSPDTSWTEVTVGAPTRSHTFRRLQAVTTALEELYWEIARPASASDNWVNSGCTVGAVCSVASGSSITTNSHGIRVKAAIDLANEFEVFVRIDTGSVRIRDIKGAATLGTLTIDTTSPVEVRIHIAADGTGTAWAARLDDYLNPVALTFSAALTSGPSGVAESEIRFGCPVASAAGDSRWVEVWVAVGTSPDDPTDPPLLGIPASTSTVVLDNGIAVAWGGQAGAGEDTFGSVPCFDFSASNVLADACVLGWRSTSGTALALQNDTLILRADRSGEDDQARFMHDIVMLCGFEDRDILIDYDSTPAFASPTPTQTLSNILWTGLEVAEVRGGTVRLDVPAATRAPFPGELSGLRARLTSGAGVGLTFCLFRHCGGFVELRRLAGGVMAPADLSTLGVLDGDTIEVFAPFGYVVLDARRRQRYMRIRFGDDDTCTLDHRLGAVLAGCRVDVPFPLEWTHRDLEESDVTLYEGPSVSWAYNLGLPRRLWTGRIVSDHTQWRDSFRALARHMAGYQTRPIGVLVDARGRTGDLAGGTQMFRGRFQPQALENSIWWDQDDGDGVYRFPVGDMSLPFVEVP